MQFINIGFGNLVSVQRLIAVVSPDSAPVKRLVQESRDRGMLIDATYGRKTASVLIMDSDHVVLSALAAERLAPRLGLSVEEWTEEDEGPLHKIGKTFIVSGPSGVGKSTVLHALFQGRDDLYFSVSATTRAPREGEQDGVDYHFIQADAFRDMIAADAFLEYAEYVGNFYGTPKMYVDDAMARGKDVILDIERQGAVQVCAKRPETVRIFIAPPSWDELERRLTARGTDTPEKIQKRLIRAQVELEMAGDYDYFVVNDTVENAVNELRAIMCAEHCKPAERMCAILSEK